MILGLGTLFVMLIGTMISSLFSLMGWMSLMTIKLIWWICSTIVVATWHLIVGAVVVILGFIMTVIDNIRNP